MQMRDVFTTDRMQVRNCRREDLPVLTAMWFDGENGKYLSDPTAEYADEKFKKALDAIEDNPHGYLLTLLLKDSEEIVGSCFLFPDERAGTFEIAYCIHKNHWRQGYATELLKAVIRWAENHGCRELIAEAARENVASNELLCKCGFSVIREASFQKYNMDVRYDSLVYRRELRATRQRVEAYLQDTYGIEAEHLWARYPEFAVYRHPQSGKWFALVMNVPGNRLGLPGTQPIPVLNVKCDPLLIGSLLTQKGFLPAYHMNKSYWISVCLDGSVPDDQILFLLGLSYDSVAPKRKKKKPTPEETPK